MPSLKNILIIFSIFLIFIIPSISAQDFTATAYTTIELCACNSTETSILVENPSTGVLQLVVSGTGSASSFAAFTPENLILLPSEYNVITEDIDIPCNVKPGTYNLQINFKSAAQTKILKQDFVVDSCQAKKAPNYASAIQILIFVSIALFFILLIVLLFIIIRLFQEKKPVVERVVVVEEPAKPKRPYPWEEYFKGRKQSRKKIVLAEERIPWKKYLVLLLFVIFILLIILVVALTIRPGQNLFTIFMPSQLNLTNATKNISATPTQQTHTSQYLPYLIAGVVILGAVILILEFIRRKSK